MASGLDPLIETLSAVAVYNNATTTASNQETTSQFQWNGRTVGLAVGTGVLVISCVALGVLINPAFFAAIPIILGGAWALMGSPTINDLIGNSTPATAEEQQPILPNLRSPQNLSDRRISSPTNTNGSPVTAEVDTTYPNPSDINSTTDPSASALSERAQDAYVRTISSPEPTLTGKSSSPSRTSPAQKAAREASSEFLKAMKPDGVVSAAFKSIFGTDREKINLNDTVDLNFAKNILIQRLENHPEFAMEFLPCADYLYNFEAEAISSAPGLTDLQKIDAKIALCDEIISIIPNKDSGIQLRLHFQGKKNTIIQNLLSEINILADRLTKNFQIEPQLIKNIETQIQELERAVGISLQDPTSPTDFASLSHTVTQQLQVATNNLNAIDRRIEISEHTESCHITRAGELIDKIKDRIGVLELASKSHGATENLTKATLKSLCQQIGDLELQKSNTPTSAAAIHQNRTLDHQILTLKIKREIYDSKLMIQNFINNNKETIKEIERLVQLKNPSEKDLEQLKSLTTSYTKTLNEIDITLTEKYKNIASYKLELSILRANLESENLNKTDSKKSELIEAINKSNKIIDFDIYNFVSLQSQLKSCNRNEDPNENVLGNIVNLIQINHNNWIHSRAETAKMRTERRPQKDMHLSAQTNLDKLMGINKLLKKQVRFINIWTNQRVFVNFVENFKKYAAATDIPKDQWPQSILTILGEKFPLLIQFPELQKPILDALMAHGIDTTQIRSKPLDPHSVLASSSNPNTTPLALMMGAGPPQPNFDDQIQWILQEAEELIPTAAPSTGNRYTEFNDAELDGIHSKLSAHFDKLKSLEEHSGSTQKSQAAKEMIELEIAYINSVQVERLVPALTYSEDSL